LLVTGDKTVLLIAATTGYQTRAFDEAASRIGVRLTLATDRCHILDDPWGDAAFAVRFEDPAGSADALARMPAKPDGIVAVGDRPAYIAALAAARLGIPYNPVDAVAASRNKYLARERFRAAGLRVPDFRRISLAESPAACAAASSYPCVLKPLGLSASRGVIRANDAQEFIDAFERIGRILRSSEVVRMGEEQDGWLQVEEFIPGRELALEGLLDGGKLRVLVLFDKPDPLDGPYFEETIYTTPSRESLAQQQAVIDATQQAVSALGLTRGPIHAEARCNGQGVWMLEVAARPIGGLCARALQFSEGLGVEELILLHAIGDDVSKIELAPGASGVMMIPIPENGIYKGAAGVEDAAAVAGISEVVITAKEGQSLRKLPEGHSYLGFLFARAEQPHQVERALRSAHSRLVFEIARELAVVR
jgi:biotin carboxylase